MNGIDWAYRRLVKAAICHSKEYVHVRAEVFKKDVLNACVGMACADIDYGSKKFEFAYRIVRDVCIELTK